MSRTDWTAVLEHADPIVNSYADTSVTLRQLFYRLVADGTLDNTTTQYKTLSSRTAEARRNGTFPDLTDRTRAIHVPLTFNGPDDATGWLERIYRRDRTEEQPWSIYLGVEKAGMVQQLQRWFGDDLGIPILALGGYSSQSYVDEVAQHADSSDRPSVLLYAGDHDASGEDIDRDFIERTDCFDKVVRVALDARQVEEYELPPQPGKPSDSRAAAFVEKHGSLVQVELDALEPRDLRALYAAALEGFWDESAYERSLTREDEDLDELTTRRGGRT